MVHTRKLVIKISQFLCIGTINQIKKFSKMSHAWILIGLNLQLYAHLRQVDFSCILDLFVL